MIQAATSAFLANKELESKLEVYKSKSNRFQFLKELRLSIATEVIKHRLTCKKDNCQYMKGSELSYMVIDQELELLGDLFHGTTDINEQFTNQEKVTVNSKIDEVSGKLDLLDLGHQVLFEELQELKAHLNLSKKTFTQLLKGKLVDVAADKAIDIAVVKMAFSVITESIGAGRLVLPF